MLACKQNWFKLLDSEISATDILISPCINYIKVVLTGLMRESESISLLLDTCLTPSKLFSNRFLTASRAKILM
jgi:hypothetical protein